MRKRTDRFTLPHFLYWRPHIIQVHKYNFHVLFSVFSVLIEPKSNRNMLYFTLYAKY